MAKQNINVGTAANDKKGDSLRAAFVKVNANFTELYTELGLINDVTLSLGAFEFTGSVLSTTDSTAIVIDQATTITSDLTVGGDLIVNGRINGAYTVNIDSSGRTTFPNGTVPEHSYGAAGDKEGMVVFTDPYIYYCKQDYVNDTTDIWVRVAWTGTSW